MGTLTHPSEKSKKAAEGNMYRSPAIEEIRSKNAYQRVSLTIEEVEFRVTIPSNSSGKH